MELTGIELRLLIDSLESSASDDEDEYDNADLDLLYGKLVQTLAVLE